jgi:hypothetical protein
MGSWFKVVGGQVELMLRAICQGSRANLGGSSVGQTTVWRTYGEWSMEYVFLTTLNTHGANGVENYMHEVF